MTATLRQHLHTLLTWSDAHASLDDAVADFPVDLRGTRPAGLPHSAWELLEHIRIAQRDIVDFCVGSTYQERKWPDEYWPLSAEPPDPRAWEKSLEAVRADRERLRELARNPDVDLASVTPHGTEQTFLRELLLVVDHTAYHVGQMVLLRRLLGAWPPS